MEFKRWFLINGLWSAVIILAVVILIFLTGKDISRRAELIRGQRQDLIVHLQSIESLALLRTGVEQANKLMIFLQNILPQEEQLIDFPKQLEGNAKANQLSFGFKFEKETPGTEKAPGANSFVATIFGTYQNFLRFLKTMEGGKYFVGLETFDLNGKGNNNFEILIKGKVYSQ